MESEGKEAVGEAERREIETAGIVKSQPTVNAEINVQKEVVKPTVVKTDDITVKPKQPKTTKKRKAEPEIPEVIPETANLLIPLCSHCTITKGTIIKGPTEEEIESEIACHLVTTWKLPARNYIRSQFVWCEDRKRIRRVNEVTREQRLQQKRYMAQSRSIVPGGGTDRRLK